MSLTDEPDEPSGSSNRMTTKCRQHSKSFYHWKAFNSNNKINDLVITNFINYFKEQANNVITAIPTLDGPDVEMDYKGRSRDLGHSEQQHTDDSKDLNICHTIKQKHTDKLLHDSRVLSTTLPYPHHRLSNKKSSVQSAQSTPSPSSVNSIYSNSDTAPYHGKCATNQSAYIPISPLRQSWRRIGSEDTGVIYNQSFLQSLRHNANADHGSEMPCNVILETLRTTGLLDRCKVNHPYPATKEECGSYDSGGSSQWLGSSAVTGGSLVEACMGVIGGELRNAIALIPHIEHRSSAGEQLQGFYQNELIQSIKALKLANVSDRIAIVDWTSHHDNETQSYFYDDPTVLYISIHGYDGSQSPPPSGAITEIGTGQGLGYTVNIPWDTKEDHRYSDAEYLAALRTIVLPILSLFSPSLVIIAAGFNAVEHQTGGIVITPEGYAYMTQLILSVCHGRVVMALQENDNSPLLPACVTSCLRTLLGSALLPLPKHIRQVPLSLSAVETLQ
eukprot:Ihof_evm5s35 gene=Ihof_evmTU5s35